MSDQNKTDSKNETDNKSDWQKRELGALWVREGKNQKYLSGHMKVETMPGVQETVKVVVFTNKNKEKNERAPDYVVYRSEDATPQSTNKVAEVTKEAVEEAAEEAVEAEVPEELF
jgi:hypothetical protein